MRSLLRMAEKASTAATSAARSLFSCVPLPKRLEALMSTTQHDGHFALLDKFLDVRRAGAGGDVPVDGADVVAGHIFAHLVELHALALEDGVVLPGEHVVDRVPGA